MQDQRTVEITTPTPTEIVIKRVFDAPARLVWRAWTEPDLVKRWQYGPEGWSMPVCEMDVRVGGGYRFEWAHTDGQRMGSRGVFKEVVQGRRLASTEVFDEAWYPGESLVTIDFVEDDGRTTVTMTMAYESPEARDMALQSNAAEGVALGYERLDEIFAAEQARTA